jgi:tRNA (guanine-N7-)-methyltransferase
MRYRSNKIGSEYSLFLDLPYQPAEPLDLERVYGNDHPVQVEIGCGKCSFLNHQARLHPDINYLGIDQVWRYMKLGVRRAQKQRLWNVRFIRMDARWVVGGHLAPGCVDIFHIYYPDPWPKPRDHKHRLLTRKFLTDLHFCLRPGGRVEIATDDFGYHIAIQKSLAGMSEPWSRIRNRADRPFFETDLRTNYEAKYLAEGRALYYVQVLK